MMTMMKIEDEVDVDENLDTGASDGDDDDYDK